MSTLEENLEERRKFAKLIEGLSADDQLLFVLAWLGTDGIRRLNSFVAEFGGKPG